MRRSEYLGVHRCILIDVLVEAIGEIAGHWLSGGDLHVAVVDSSLDETVFMLTEPSLTVRWKVEFILREIKRQKGSKTGHRTFTLIPKFAEGCFTHCSGLFSLYKDDYPIAVGRVMVGGEEKKHALVRVLYVRPL